MGKYERERVFLGVCMCVKGTAVLARWDASLWCQITHVQILGLARTIYIQCIHGIIGRGIV